MLPNLTKYTKNIKGLILTHAHLDHIAGMIINSPEDTKKPILAQTNVINDLKDYIFNWRIYPKKIS